MQYVNCFIQIPSPVADKEEYLPKSERNTGEYRQYCKDNTIRDVVDTEFHIGGAVNKYGPRLFDPILPGLARTWSITLNDNFMEIERDRLVIKWSTHADNAPPTEGEINVTDIPIIDIST